MTDSYLRIYLRYGISAGISTMNIIRAHIAIFVIRDRILPEDSFSERSGPGFFMLEVCCHSPCFACNALDILG